MGFFDFLRGRSNGCEGGPEMNCHAILFDDSGVTSVVGSGNSFAAFGPSGITSGFANLDDDGNGTVNAFGPDGISTTFARGSSAFTFGPDGRVSTTVRHGNTFTTFGADGRMHTTFRNGNTFTTLD